MSFINISAPTPTWGGGSLLARPCYLNSKVGLGNINGFYKKNKNHVLTSKEVMA